MKIIQCNCGKPILVSDEDFDNLKSYSWTCSNGGGSVFTNIKVQGNQGQYKCIRIGKFVLGESELEVDHKDLDVHNNQRSNLRLATSSENKCNRPARKDNMTGYKGVSPRLTGTGKKKWLMCIAKDGKRVQKSYLTAEDAARGYDKYAREMHGEFAHLNFP